MADSTSGKARHLGGKIEEAAGDLLGDRKMKAKGRLQQVEGVAEQDMANAEDELTDAAARKANARRVRRSQS